jgi:hypothetical protein
VLTTKYSELVFAWIDAGCNTVTDVGESSKPTSFAANNVDYNRLFGGKGRGLIANRFFGKRGSLIRRVCAN